MDNEQINNNENQNKEMDTQNQNSPEKVSIICI